MAALRICDSLRFTKVSDLALAGRTPAQVIGAMLPPSPGKSSATLDSTRAFFAVKHRHQHLQGRKVRRRVVNAVAQLCHRGPLQQRAGQGSRDAQISPLPPQTRSLVGGSTLAVCFSAHRRRNAWGSITVIPLLGWVVFYGRDRNCNRSGGYSISPASSTRTPAEPNLERENT